MKPLTILLDLKAQLELQIAAAKNQANQYDDTISDKQHSYYWWGRASALDEVYKAILPYV